MNSWIAENQSDGSGPDDPNFDERISDIIAETVGGRSRAASQNSNLRSSPSPIIQQNLRPTDERNRTREQQQLPQPNNKNNEPPSIWRANQFEERRQFPPMQTYQTAGNVSSKALSQEAAGNRHQEERRQQQNSSSGRAASNQSSIVVSEDDFERHHRQLIQSHPEPGQSAQRLAKLVNELQYPPVRYGSESRVRSSREMEQHRAGSSHNPPITPLLKDNEPDVVLLRDSPRNVQTQTPAQLLEQNFGQQPDWIMPPTAPSTQIKQPQPSAHQQQLLKRNRSTQTPAMIQMPTTHPPQFSPIPHHQHHSSHLSPPYLPSPLPSPNHHHQYRKYHHHHRPHHYSSHRSLSSADFPPLYNFANRPWWPKASNMLHYGTNPYRENHLNSVVKALAGTKQSCEKLQDWLKLYDKGLKQDIIELDLDQRGFALDVRRRFYDQDLEVLKQEEHELEMRKAEWIDARRQLTPPPPASYGRSPKHPTSILKKPPPPRSSSSAPHVEFRSPPIRSVNVYSPNQSRADSSANSIDARENGHHQRANSIAGHRSPKQPRLAFSNRTNPVAPPANGHSTRPPPSSPVDAQADRDRESKRVDYVNKWQRNRQHLRQAKRTNTRINLNSNPTSIFQRIPN